MLERSEYIYSIPDGLTGEKNQDNIVPFINYKEAAPQRCLEMLLKKTLDVEPILEKKLKISEFRLYRLPI